MFWTRTLDYDYITFAVEGCGVAPADCAGECARTGERLGMGVG